MCWMIISRHDVTLTIAETKVCVLDKSHSVSAFSFTLKYTYTRSSVMRVKEFDDVDDEIN